jgi:formylglycine-generating enzyme required for sulfatase activity
MSEPVKVFLSYSHRDEELRNELVQHLSGLVRSGKIEIWHDRKILAGTEWAEQIDKNLEQAQIVLFLVSADFIDSQYCFDIEMTRALERHNGKTAHVIPVIVRDCDWHHAPFAKLQAVPTDGKAVMIWGADRYAQDRAWTVVAKEIGKIAQQILDELQAPKVVKEKALQETVQNKETPEPQAKELEPQPSRKMVSLSDESESSKNFKFEVTGENVKDQETVRFPNKVEFFTEDLGNGVTVDMVKIPGGTFQMGSNEHESEQPLHTVMVAPFWMGKYSVTQAQYESVMEKNPSKSKGAKRPVETVSWHNAVEFCKRLSQKTGQNYRLPSEAEWEYACRAGTTTPFHFGTTLTTDLANYTGNHSYSTVEVEKYLKETTEVGTFLPNNFGVYDMHGNVWEWCEDNWHRDYQEAPHDGSAWVNKGDDDYRRVRGGSWSSRQWSCRSAYRYYSRPYSSGSDIGFRVVCTSSKTS